MAASDPQPQHTHTQARVQHIVRAAEPTSFERMVLSLPTPLIKAYALLSEYPAVLVFGALLLWWLWKRAGTKARGQRRSASAPTARKATLGA